MKNKTFSTLINVVAIFASSFVWAQPVVRFDQENIDYGTVAQGTNNSRKVRFKNTGDTPLIIRNAKGSCGCLVPKYPKEPIMPNESGYLEVLYDTQRIGKFIKTVTIETNETNQHLITVSGEVYQSNSNVAETQNKNGQTVSTTYWNENFKIVSSLKMKDGELTLEKKINLSDYRVNPDGTKYYKTTLAVGITIQSDKKLNIIETDIYTTSDYSKAMLPCMAFDIKNNTISIFTNSKASDRMYGMDGYTYQINLNTKTWLRESVFQGANWGWYSFFGGVENGNPELWHFAYAGYYSMYSYRQSNGNWQNQNKGSFKPETADYQYYYHSNILLAEGMGVDKMNITIANEAISYSKYNSGGSDVSLTDIIETGVNIYAGYKILKNLWDIGSTVTSNDMSKTMDNIALNISKCATERGVKLVSDNPYVANAISTSVGNVLRDRNITINDISSSVLNTYVKEDLKKRGYSEVSDFMSTTSLLKCLIAN